MTLHTHKTSCEILPLVKSHYSLMWGTASVKELCRHARQLGYYSLALTDTDNLYGLWQFVSACKDQGITPVIGAEITDPDSDHTAICLVKNDRGYSQLTRLITRRHTDKNFSLQTMLPMFSSGLAILTTHADLLQAWYPHNIDLWANMGNSPLSMTHPLCRTAKDLDIPLMATPNSYFLTPDDFTTHCMLRAIDQKTSFSCLSYEQTAHRTAFLPDPDTFKKKFSILPMALKNTACLVKKIEFQKPDFGIVMPPLKGNQTLPPEKQLYLKTMKGAQKRYGTPLPSLVIDRIKYELSIIQQKNFCEYFLVVQTIVQKASRICGRGSGAASIVAYCLGVTNVCPIKHDLYFERFLNPDRTDPPDIDIDFAWDERDDILNWVLKEFPNHSALVSSHILFQPRMAVREVARVFGLPEAEISKISKRLPWFWQRDELSQNLLDRIKARPEFKDLEFPPPWPQIMAHAHAITGNPRHLSVHPGGMIITPRPIDTYVPLEIAPKGVPIIQWEKDSAEMAGLVKIDLLGNRSLGVIRDTISSITKQTGTFNDFSTIDPEDDYETQQNVAQGNTMGCFYIESPAMRLLQKKTNVGDFQHLVIHSSIIRPAANEFIQDYIKRLHTGIWDPIHPILEDILDQTFGIMVFQEDVSKVAVKMAGFTHANADGLRKIISKKDKEKELADYFQQFRNGALANNVSEETIRLVWKMIISFSGYSFCKPHSASYARVSFQAAYLKTHYPAQFMAAVISNQGGFYSTFAYVSEAKRLGIKILHPDINYSNFHWKGDNQRLKVGFLSIKHLSRATLKRLLKERKKQPFTTPQDFFTRVRPQEEDVRALVHSGCLDEINPDKNRGALLWSFAVWQKNRTTKHASLIRTTPSDIDIPQLPPDDPDRKLQNEFATLGFLCSCHPMELYQHLNQNPNIIKACHIHHHEGEKILFAGWLITGKIVRTKGGDPMKFLTFEDETGIVETVFFPKPYARFCHMMDMGKPYLLKGRPESNWGAIALTVQSVSSIQ